MQITSAFQVKQTIQNQKHLRYQDECFDFRKFFNFHNINLKYLRTACSCEKRLFTDRQYTNNKA